MAYLAPLTEVYLLKNVPLDRTYKHTITFSSKSAQETYFKSKQAKSLSTQTFQKVYPEPTGIFQSDWNRNHSIVCNYLMFRNPQGEGGGTDKWFYAFITDIEYRNSNVAWIHFELDLLQTYMFDYEVKQCFVEREHVNDDSIGRHTVPEPVDLGSYVAQSKQKTGNFKKYSVMIGYVQAEGSGSISAAYHNNIFSGVFYKLFPCDTYEEAVSIGSFLAGFTETGDNENIVSINFVPSFYARTADDPVTYNITAQGRPNGLGSNEHYVPRNNKLLSFPYVALKVTTGEGDSQLLAFEHFDNPSEPKFYTASYMGTTPEIMCVPKDYSGEELNYDYKIGISNFPTCAYAIDSYKAYLAMNQGQQQLNLATNILGNISNPIGAISSIGIGAFQNTVNAAKAATQTDRPKGSQTGNAMVALRELDFYTIVITIRPEFARIIDDIFDKTGYEVDRVKKPNITGRPNWNYVKTRDCTIVCDGDGIPAGSMEKICDIYNNGITFWHSPSAVGNYSLNNK